MVAGGIRARFCTRHGAGVRGIVASVQTTANLWDQLCRELESSRSVLTVEKLRLAAKQFKETAAQVFRNGSRRHCDALEMAGDICQETGYFAEAAADFEEALAQNLEARHLPAAARIATKLALLFDQQEDVANARKYYARALELFESAHDRSQHCMLLSNLAGIERRAGDFKAAEASYLKALDVSIGVHGEIDPEVALVCNNLGVAYGEAGDWTQAETLHLRALGIREQVFGSMNPEVAQSLSNLAVLYHSSGSLAKAERYYEAALKTYAATRLPDDPEIASVQANFENLKQMKP